jgi:hypothetical protein
MSRMSALFGLAEPRGEILFGLKELEKLCLSADATMPLEMVSRVSWSSSSEHPAAVHQTCPSISSVISR